MEVDDATLPGRSERAASGRSEAGSSLCAFWLDARCFALETRLVGEVVTVEDYIVLPLSPPAVRGVFSLRGEPVPLVDTDQVLGLSSQGRALPKAPVALVLRERELVVGLVVSRVQGVLSVDTRDVHPAASAEDDPGLLGFLDLELGATRTVVSVLSASFVLGSLNALRVANPGAPS
jgi:chemotaxis signal transduction protein